MLPIECVRQEVRKGFACLIDSLRSRKMLRSIGGAVAAHLEGWKVYVVFVLIHSSQASGSVERYVGGSKAMFATAANQRVAVCAAGAPAVSRPFVPSQGGDRSSRGIGSSWVKAIYTREAGV